MSLKNLSVKIKTPKLLKSKLSNKKVAQIYQEFENTLNIDQSFAVAVSGGPDSLALAFLSKISKRRKSSYKSIEAWCIHGSNRRKRSRL